MSLHPPGQAVIIRSIDGVDYLVDGLGRLQVVLASGDIQIGALEIKDGVTDQRATVFNTGALKVSGDSLTSGNGDYGSVTVTATPTVIVGGRPDLKGVLMVPLGTVYLGLTNSVSSSNGIIMYSGDVYKDGGEGVYTGDIYGVTSSGSVGVRYQRRW